MKIPINQLKTCPINSEIYRDSDVGDLVNSIGEVGLLQPVDNIPYHRQTIRTPKDQSNPFFSSES